MGEMIKIYLFKGYVRLLSLKKTNKYVAISINITSVITFSYDLA